MQLWWVILPFTAQCRTGASVVTPQAKDAQKEEVVEAVSGLRPLLLGEGGQPWSEWGPCPHPSLIPLGFPLWPDGWN